MERYVISMQISNTSQFDKEWCHCQNWKMHFAWLHSTHQWHGFSVARRSLTVWKCVLYWIAIAWEHFIAVEWAKVLHGVTDLFRQTASSYCPETKLSQRFAFCYLRHSTKENEQGFHVLHWLKRKRDVLRLYFFSVIFLYRARSFN